MDHRRNYFYLWLLRRSLLRSSTRILTWPRSRTEASFFTESTMIAETITPLVIVEELSKPTAVLRSCTEAEVSLVRLGLGEKIHVYIRGKSICLIENNPKVQRWAKYINIREQAHISDVCKSCYSLVIRTTRE